MHTGHVHDIHCDHDFDTDHDGTHVHVYDDRTGDATPHVYYYGSRVDAIRLSHREQLQHLNHIDDDDAAAERQQFIRNQLDAVLNDNQPSRDDDDGRNNLRDVADRIANIGHQLHQLNINPIDGHQHLGQHIINLGVAYRNLRHLRDTLRRDQHPAG